MRALIHREARARRRAPDRGHRRGDPGAVAVFPAGVRRRGVKIPAWLLALILAGPAAAGPAAEPHDRIRAAVQVLVDRHLPPGRDREVGVGRLDPRLRVPRCDRGLEAFLPAGSRLPGMATVGVRCAGPHPWLVYVPVTVRLYEEVLVARRNLPRGTRLEADDLELARRDVAPLTGGYLRDPAAARGKVLRRPVALGQVLAPGWLKAETLVRRGERVTLLARGGGMEVRMAGRALRDGAEGERIPVRNLSSRRVVEGQVVARSTVEVPL